MIAYIVRRLFFLIFVLFGVSLLLFGILMTFSPERRAAVYVLQPQQFEDIPRIIKQYGLDDPFYLQYGRWLKELLHGNFGWSLVAGKPVLAAFLDYMPPTIELTLYMLPLMLWLGIWLGAWTGIRHNTAFDHVGRILAIVGWSLPTFLFALVLLMIFYGYFPLFPPGILSDQNMLFIEQNPELFRRYTLLYSIDGILNGRWDITLDALRHLAMPVLTEVVVMVAVLVRVMRSSMIEEISRDYVITARAKGADFKTVYMKHARKNALIPVVTVAGALVAYGIEGSIATEIVFNRKGLGWWVSRSATQLDLPVVMAICLFIASVYVLINLILDITYAVIDPRIRLE